MKKLCVPIKHVAFKTECTVTQSGKLNGKVVRKWSGYKSIT